MPVATVEAYRNPLQAAPRSNAAACFAPERLLHQAGRGGHELVGRDRRQNDQVEFGGLDARVGTGLPARGDGHRGRGFVGCGDPALADAGPLDDPLIAGVDHSLELGIVEHALGHVAAGAVNGGAKLQAEISVANQARARLEPPLRRATKRLLKHSCRDD